MCPEIKRSVSQGESEIIVFKQRTHVASPNMGNLRKEGFHGGGEIEDSPQAATKAREIETKASRSSELRTDPATHKADVQRDPGIVSLANWGRASQRKVWIRPTILSDEPRDLTEFPAEAA